MEDTSQVERDALAVQKREALARISEVWKDALGAGIESEVLAHVALFAALGDLVSTYGEPAVAEFAKRLPERITSGEFSIASSRH
jgi:hypothetical protein